MPIILSKTLFFLFSLVIAIFDLKKGIVPRVVFLLAFPVFFVLHLLKADNYPLYVAFTGAFLGFIIFILAFFISGRKLGLADIWYSSLIGLVLGPVWWFPAIGIACLSGASWIIISKKHRIPFIPCMAIGGVSISFMQGWFQ
jgi:prepilin signal peptidase PulO-like enzyme (type II secretory pathway)